MRGSVARIHAFILSMPASSTRSALLASTRGRSKLRCKTPKETPSARDTGSIVPILTSLGRKHIRDSIEVTEYYHRAMPVEHARNLFKLSEALLQVEDDVNAAAEAATYREKEQKRN